jgi:uncharacterized protein
MGYLLFVVPFLLLGQFVQRRLIKTFRKNATIAVSNRMTGAEVARAILDANGMHNVQIGSAGAQPLSDHYDPRSKAVNLSGAVYGERSLAASAVAAHEVGHAMQHAKGWSLFRFRSALFKPVAFAQKAWFFAFIAASFIGSRQLLLAAMGLYGLVILFQLVTLPVELNASHRAKEQLRKLGLVDNQEDDGAADVLGAAAWTYVAGALASVGQILMYLLPMLLGGIGGIGRASS